MHKDAARLHQVHPIKLATDLASAALGLWFLWTGHAAIGILVVLVPPLVATLLLLRGADLAPLATTRLGRAVVARMPGALQGLRIAGLLVAAVGAVLHVGWEIVLGLAIVLAAWLPTIAHAARGRG